jgi:hypothetical protein
MFDLKYGCYDNYFKCNNDKQKKIKTQLMQIMAKEIDVHVTLKKLIEFEVIAKAVYNMNFSNNERKMESTDDFVNRHRIVNEGNIHCLEKSIENYFLEEK